MGNQQEFTSLVVRHLPELTKEERQYWIERQQELSQKLKDCLRVPGIGSFLSCVSFRPVCYSKGTFHAKDHFVSTSSVKFCLGRRFVNNFLHKIEMDTGVSGVKEFTLTRKTTAAEIWNEFNEIGVRETFLAHIYQIIVCDGNEESPNLFVDGKENIFLARNMKGVVEAVVVTYLSSDSTWMIESHARDFNRQYAQGYKVYGSAKMIIV